MSNEELKEAVEYLRACEKTNPFITRHTKSLDLVLQAAEQAAELRDKLEIQEAANGIVGMKYQSLRQRVKELEGALEMIRDERWLSVREAREMAKEALNKSRGGGDA